MNRFAARGQRRFRERFPDRRMCMDRRDDFVHGRLQTDGERPFDDKIRRTRTDDVESENFVVFLPTLS